MKAQITSKILPMITYEHSLMIAEVLHSLYLQIFIIQSLHKYNLVLSFWLQSNSSSVCFELLHVCYDFEFNLNRMTYPKVKTVEG